MALTYDNPRGTFMHPTEVATEASGGLQAQQVKQSGVNPLSVPVEQQVSGGKTQKQGGLFGMTSAQNQALSFGGGLATAAMTGGAAAMGTAAITGVAGIVLVPLAMKLLGMGDEKKPIVSLATGKLGTSPEAFEDGYMLQSKLGTVGLSDSGSANVKASDKQLRSAVEGIVEFDNVIADYIGQDGIDAVQEVLSKPMGNTQFGWQATMESNDIIGRYNMILGAAADKSPAAKNALELVKAVSTEASIWQRAYASAGRTVYAEADRQAKQMMGEYQWNLAKSYKPTESTGNDMSGSMGSNGAQEKAVYDQIIRSYSQGKEGELVGRTGEIYTSRGGVLPPDVMQNLWKVDGTQVARAEDEGHQIDLSKNDPITPYVRAVMAGLQGYTMDDLSSGKSPITKNLPKTLSHGAAAKEASRADVADKGYLKYLRDKFPGGQANEAIDKRLGGHDKPPGYQKELNIPRGYFEQYRHYRVKALKDTTGGLR
jgi:hypothetical protein